MADITYRANLKASSIPLLSELQGRTVMVRQQDQNFVPGMTEKNVLTDAETSLGVPQIYYAHNVMPSATGYCSVGYKQFTNNAELPGDSDFIQVEILRDDTGNAAQLGLTAAGNLYIFTALSGKWVTATGAPAAGTIAGKRMTVALVSGVTYIYFATIGCYYYNFGTATLVSQALAGVTAASTLGIAGAFGYLLVYSVDAIAWSSTIDPTDFVPSLTTGAGGGQVENARGKLVTIEPVYGALIVFTDSNAVAAIYSGNVRYPFNFTAVSGAGGLTDYNFVTSDSGTGSLYAYTTSGLQSITAKQATTLYPEITDFLSGYYFEDFNESTLEFSTTTYDLVVQKRLVLVSDRYLVISYGTPTSLTHAIVYDLSLKQFGKLKIAHVDCFEFQLYNQTAIEVPKRSIGFLQNNGTIQVLDFDIDQGTHVGIILLGKYQYVRSRFLQLQNVELENINTGATFSCYDLPALDGKVFEPAVEGYLAASSGKYRRYAFHNTALNHSILGKGQFALTSLVLNFNIAGAR